MHQKRVTTAAGLGLLAMLVMGGGCPGGGVLPLPFGDITAVQLFDEPNYTMALSVEDAVADPSQITKVNWVFGDGSGFEEGEPNRATISHRYDAPGNYTVSAFLFDASGFQEQIDTTITVAEDDDDSGPGPNPDPEGLPGRITSPSPIDGATNVSVEALLRWVSGVDADTHDVYLGTDEDDVEDADNDSAAIFRGNQSDNEYDPAGLDEDTEYFWRVDEVNDAGTTKGIVRSFRTAKLPTKAKNPSPANGSLSARVDGSLSWTAGDNTTTHDVYFGKSLSAVENATEDDDDIFQGNQGALTFNPEDEDATLEGELLPDTNYYWRIDEVGNGGTAKGTVWNFRTRAAPPQITSVTPVQGAINVDISEILSWTAPSGIESYDIYFGTDSIEVEDGTRDSATYMGNRTVQTFDPPTLTGNTEYFWRVDTLGPGGTTKGLVFSFMTAIPPGQVVGPFTPLHNATSVNVETMLAWGVGAGGPTTSFDVYLSTSSSAVTNGSAAALQGSQDVAQTSFQPTSALTANSTYFWRVDAVGPGGKTTGSVRSFTTGSLPNQASNPTPPNNQLGVDINVTLMWAAGLNATSHDVYLGTNQSDVNNAGKNDAAFKANVAGNNYLPGELEGNTQYFWRIDAVGPGGATKGTIWRFTTAPARATAPVPANNATNISMETELSWTAATGATSHDIYFGDDQSAVENATTSTAGIFKINQTGTTFNPTPGFSLLGNETYYWRIDEVNAAGKTKGTVWTFTTGPGQAATPISPLNGATNVDLSPTLMWTAGAGASDHEIYLGTNQTAVENATTASAEFQGTQSLGSETFTPGSPLLGFTTYFWRIDETGPGGMTKGVVWQFKTKPGKATNPVPANLATGITINPQLQWTAAAGAVSHEVYIGTNESDVINSTATTVLGTVELITTSDTTVAPTGPLTADTLYFWRVDSVAGDGTTRTQGNTWRFRTIAVPGQAGAPSPFNGATNVDTDISTTLNWSAADRATSYDVYFGTSLAAVQNATTASPEFQGNQSTRSYSAGTLADSTSYFWRIDAVNEAGTTKGVVWSFITEPP